jgi:predicted amidophosphoribosyltransferase
MKIDPDRSFGTRECPSCACDVPANNNRCPICGYEFPDRLPHKRWTRILLALLMLVLLLLFFVF